jgi:hypothetical protein
MIRTSGFESGEPPIAGPEFCIEKLGIVVAREECR